MYGFYDFRMGQVQALVVALKFLCAARKRSLAVVFFRESVSLDHRAHSSIQNQYPVIVYVDHTFS